MATLELSRDPKKAGGEPEPDAQATDVQVAAQEGSALGALRSIVFGDLPKQQEQAIARLRNSFAAQTATLCGEFDALVRRLQNRIDEMDARSTGDRGNLREQMATQKNGLSHAIKERNTQVTQLVNEGVAELRESKLDCDHFSGFLARMATHLEGQAPSGSESAEQKRAGRPSTPSKQA